MKIVTESNEVQLDYGVLADNYNLKALHSAN